jgi:hypothetical protein
MIERVRLNAESTLELILFICLKQKANLMAFSLQTLYRATAVECRRSSWHLFRVEKEVSRDQLNGSLRPFVSVS